MNSATSGWVIFTRKLLAGFHPQNDTLTHAIAELLAAKRLAGRRERYLVGLSQYLRLFARGREEMTVDQFRVEDIEEWFAGRREKPSTRIANSFRIAGLFAFCIRRGYCDSNPCDALEAIRIEPKPPVIFTPRQVAKSLVWAKRRGKPLLAWLVLGVLCGLRPEEADKTTEGHINLEAGTVTVDASASKVWQRRVVHLTDQAKAWLRLCLEISAPFNVGRTTRRRSLRKLRNYLKLPSWPQDVLRHTFASYRMAVTQDAGKLAAEMGNSADVLLRHYRELLTKSDAAKYSRLFPHIANRSALPAIGATASTLFTFEIDN